MWADVQMGPYFKKYHQGRAAAALFGTTAARTRDPNVSAVAEVFAEWGITAENLPPNMTDLLQVMDLVVNGPVKTSIRAARIDALFVTTFNRLRSSGCSTRRQKGRFAAAAVRPAET